MWLPSKRARSVRVSPAATSLMISGLLAGGLMVLSGLGGCKKDEPVAPPATSSSTTAPSTQPATTAATTQAAKDEPKPLSYFDVVRSVYPDIPATQPLAMPVTLKEASRFVIKDPLLLDEQGHLWITRAGTPPMESTLRASADAPGNEHVVPDRVLFAWWVPDKSGDWTPMTILSTGSAFQLVTSTRRQPMGARSDYDWTRARSWTDGDQQRLVVPTADGLSVFTYHGQRQPPTEVHQPIARPAGEKLAVSPKPATEPSPSASVVRFAFEPQGLLAWVPPMIQPAALAAGDKPPEEPKDDAKPDSQPAGNATTVFRFVKNEWQPLPAAEWPANILHLIPLRDGSVTQLLADGPGLKLAFSSLAASPVDRKAIDDLLDRLGDGDVTVRNDAFQQLANFGPGLLPVLKNIPEQDLSPAARVAVRGLLRRQTAPMIGGLATKPEHLRLVRRLSDGGILLYTEDGVTFPNPEGDDPIRQAPAWIAARPGRPVELLPASLMTDVQPADPQVDVIGGKWVVTTDGHGPRVYVASLFKDLLRKSDATYTKVVGLDRSGRWLFRQASEPNGPTLIIDPTVADFSRLPVWVFDNKAPEGQQAEGLVGWDKAGWPAVKQGTIERRLMESDWAALGENNPILTEVPAGEEKPVPPAIPIATPTTKPATTPSAGTNPSTLPIAASPVPAGPPLLVDPSGNRYFGGEEQLTVVRADGTRIDWPLQGTSIGQPPVTLIFAASRLYLFNAPGRVLRIKPTPGGPQPFLVEKSFARDIPNGEAPKRIWLDPAGRIILAMEQKLVILFPKGYIPPAIREKMRDEEEDEN